MNRSLAIILGVVLMMIGILTGGCSLAFTSMIRGNDNILLLIWLSGFGIGGLSIWGAFRLLRGPQPPQE